MTDEEIKRATKAALAAKPVVTLKKGKRVKEGEEGEEGEEDQKPSRVNKHFSGFYFIFFFVWVFCRHSSKQNGI